MIAQLRRFWQRLVAEETARVPITNRPWLLSATESHERPLATEIDEHFGPEYWTAIDLARFTGRDPGTPQEKAS